MNSLRIEIHGCQSEFSMTSSASSNSFTPLQRQGTFSRKFSSVLHRSIVPTPIVSKKLERKSFLDSPFMGKTELIGFYANKLDSITKYVFEIEDVMDGPTLAGKISICVSKVRDQKKFLVISIYPLILL